MTGLFVKDLALAVLVTGVAAFVSAFTSGASLANAASVAIGAVGVMLAKAINPTDPSYGVNAGEPTQQ